jgi:hypothetical protein
MLGLFSYIVNNRGRSANAMASSQETVLMNHGSRKDLKDLSS